MMTLTNHGLEDWHSHIKRQQEGMMEVMVAMVEVEVEVEGADSQGQQETQTIETMAQS